MLFLNQFILKKTYIKIKKQRKEQDSFSAHHNRKTTLPKQERASVFASLKASLTVEASLTVPIFFFAVLCFCCLLEIMAIQLTVRSAVREVCKKTAEEAYLHPMLLPASMESDIVKIIGEERLNRSMIKEGSGGIDCSKSRMSPATGIMDVSVRYEIRLPVSFFGGIGLSCEENVRAKGWNGYEKEGFSGEREETVYVTETGVVYHKDYHCTYLDLSIQMATTESIGEVRNEAGGKYYPCEKCGAHTSENGALYITSSGDRYHKTLGCSGLKRSVYAIPVSEAVGKGACSRCAKS